MVVKDVKESMNKGIYLSLKVKVTLFVVFLSLLGLSSLAYFFVHVEQKMVQKFEKEKVELIKTFVSSTLNPVMINGSAEVMSSILASYKHIANMEKVVVVRVDGREAFMDDATVREVNERIGWEKFFKEISSEPSQVIRENDSNLMKILSTGESVIIEEKEKNKGSYVKMMIPIKNEAECHICHGDDHEIRGLLLASFSMNKIEKEVSANNVDFIKYAFLVIILMSGILFVVFRGMVVNPIADIVEQVNSVVLHDRYDLRLAERSKDEIGEMAMSFNSFISAVEKYRIEQASEKERLEIAVQEKTRELREKNRVIEDDLKIAGRVQKGVLPTMLPEVPGYSFHAVCLPCMYVGGDYYDVYQIDNEHIGIFIGDATGHGSSAALLVSIVKTLLMSDRNKSLSPAVVTKNINDFMFRNTPDDVFLTLFLGVIEVKTGKMTYTLAGHPSPVVFRSADNSLEKLELCGGMVGSFEGNLFEEKEIVIGSGSRMLLYTDGLTEAASAKGEEFGMERVSSLVSGKYNLRSSEIIGEILKTLEIHTGGASLSDDVTMLVVDYNKNGSG